MSRLICVLLAILLQAANANAYMICSEPDEPYIPSGYGADRYQMENAKQEVEDYLNEIREYRECLLRNLEEAKSDAENVIEEWNDAVRQYNSSRR